MAFKDLDEELERLKIKPSWEDQVDGYVKSQAGDISRLKRHNIENRASHLQRMKEWRERRYEEAKKLVGHAKCTDCCKPLKVREIVRNWNRCYTCKLDHDLEIMEK